MILFNKLLTTKYTLLNRTLESINKGPNSNSYLITFKQN